MTSKFAHTILDRVKRAYPPESVSVSDMMEIVKMVRNCDLVHVDAIDEWASDNGLRIVEHPQPAPATPEALFDGAAYAASRGQ